MQSACKTLITCMTAQCDACIVKPFTRQTIARCLNKIFQDYVNNVLITDE